MGIEFLDGIFRRQEEEEETRSLSFLPPFKDTRFLFSRCGKMGMEFLDDTRGGQEEEEDETRSLSFLSPFKDTRFLFSRCGKMGMGEGGGI